MRPQTILTRYTYDPLDRLASCTPLAEAIAQRFYKTGEVVTEIQGAEQRTYMRTGSQLLAQKNLTASTLLATDPQNSVLHAEDMAITYAPYGHREAVSALPGLPGFNGEQPDPVTGHYLLGNGYRAYNPILMRFNSPDSLSPFGEGGLNAYAYCVGDPVNRSDPTGHFGWLMGLAGLAGGSALGTGIAAVATAKSAPETSKALGYVTGGLVMGALGLGAVGQFQTLGRGLTSRFAKELSGKNAGRKNIVTVAQVKNSSRESAPDMTESLRQFSAQKGAIEPVVSSNLGMRSRDRDYFYTGLNTAGAATREVSIFNEHARKFINGPMKQLGIMTNLTVRGTPLKEVELTRFKSFRKDLIDAAVVLRQLKLRRLNQIVS
ncbi:RHS repeat-associated core domain-containing protein [Pseudomonas syringae]|uniref:RHS repeat-associated core domain-containing protein n=1 Tax=Pseudomonas syringae TaxID=317 RepID=UPI00067D833A|nr:RHS repeat-associated core domain-containing protein [Pseudomonas syringae]